MARWGYDESSKHNALMTWRCRTNRITAWIRQGAYQRMVFRFNIIFMILSHWYNLGDPRTLISRPKNFETQYLTLGAGHISMGLQEVFRFLVSNFRGCSWITDVSGRAEISSIENEIGKNKRPLPRSNATNFYPKTYSVLVVWFS